jgi:perosamine synthetase
VIIPHSKPMIDKEDTEAVAEVLASGHIAHGEKVREFENAVARLVGTKYGVAVSSGTAALHLALLCLGVRAGDEVILPSYVCTSPYHSILYVGGIPRIVDISSQDLNICSETVKEQLSPHTKSIIVPHMFGCPAELDELLDLDIPIIEDCAQALGAGYKNSQVGSFGEMSIFSFYANKMIATGEGGMILTNNFEYCEKLKDLRNYDNEHARTSLTPVRYNYRMTDIQAALGISQLKKLRFFIERRRRIASLYTEKLAECGFRVLDYSSQKNPVFYRYIVMVDDVERIRNAARNMGMMCERPVAVPLHKCFPNLKCPSSDGAYEQALSVPIYPSLTEDELEYIVRTFDLLFRHRSTPGR